MKSWTLSRNSRSSSSLGGVKPAGCFVDMERAKAGASAGMMLRRRERVDVRRKGAAIEAIVHVSQWTDECEVILL